MDPVIAYPTKLSAFQSMAAVLVQNKIVEMHQAGMTQEDIALYFGDKDGSNKDIQCVIRYTIARHAKLLPLRECCIS